MRDDGRRVLPLGCAASAPRSRRHAIGHWPLRLARIEGVAQAVADRLNDSTSAKLDTPGHTAIHGAWSR